MTASTAAATPALRVWPAVGRRAARLFERNVYVYRSSWVILASGLAEPLFYLGSVGLGFGHLVGQVPLHGRTIPYTDFVAPALLAASAMNGAIFDSTFNVFFKIKYMKTYDAVLATPVGPLDIAVGEVGWSLTRGLIYATAFLAVMVGMGLVHSWWTLAVLPAATLVGFCFGGLGIAATCYMRSWQDFDFIQLATLPMFLFSSTFYPLSAYSPVVQHVVRATPLYNGVALLRSLTLGDVGVATVGHVAYLAVLGALGVAVASRRLGRRLLP
ncbi:MAG TPA: ABC transporter permease [Mycobacteriales bacterium]|nr:ABC transporter permease [Mycobacteriales bacterium]